MLLKKLDSLGIYAIMCRVLGNIDMGDIPKIKLKRKGDGDD